MAAKTEKTIALDSLTPNKKNPRKISVEAFKMLCRSIRRDPRFMELRPMIVDKDNVVILGNQRYRACLEIGKKVVPASWVRKVTDLTPEQRKRFIVLDNSPEGMSGYWDFTMLGEDFKMPELEALGFVFPEKVDISKAWQGMPELEEKEQEGFQKITVHFATKKDVERFAKLIGQKINERTKFIWIPEKVEGVWADKRYRSES